MSVTVYIPNRNMADTLEASVRSALLSGADEVVVIDDASTDRSIDVVTGMMRQNRNLKCITRRVRSRCWQESAADHFDGFAGAHVIALGADDVLAEDLADRIRETGDAPIVFTDYFVIRPGESQVGLVAQGVKETTALTAKEVCDRYMSDANPTETGIGSAIRKDLLLWLKKRRFWEMGPWSDAIGYGAVAAIHGAVYLNTAGAAILDNKSGYGAAGREGINAAAYKQAAKEFIIRTPELDLMVGNRLLAKRGCFA